MLSEAVQYPICFAPTCSPTETPLIVFAMEQSQTLMSAQIHFIVSIEHSGDTAVGTENHPGCEP